MSEAGHSALVSDPGPARPVVWQNSPRRALPDEAPVLSVEGFDGPLDWLLDMARAEKIDLARLPIAALIESFVIALDLALSKPDGQQPLLSRWGDWLVMAATLTHLRSRLLLPPDAPEARAAIGEAEALRRHLVRREQMLVAGGWLARQPQLGQEVFGRGRPEMLSGRHRVDLVDLLRSCLSALRVSDALIETYSPRPPPFWRMSQAIAWIERLLGEFPPYRALSMFLPPVDPRHADRGFRCRVAVASTLVAGLELARNGGLALDQDTAWAPILVTATKHIPPL